MDGYICVIVHSRLNIHQNCSGSPSFTLIIFNTKSVVFLPWFLSILTPTKSKSLPYLNKHKHGADIYLFKVSFPKLCNLPKWWQVINFLFFSSHAENTFFSTCVKVTGRREKSTTPINHRNEQNNTLANAFIVFAHKLKKKSFPLRFCFDMCNFLGLPHDVHELTVRNTSMNKTVVAIKMKSMILFKT